MARKIKPKYLACIWCGGDMPSARPHAKYCSEDCKRHKITHPKKSKFTLTLKNYFDKDRPHISRTMITDYLKSPELYKKKYIDRTVEFKVTMPIQRGSMVDEVLTQGKNSYELRFQRTCLKRDSEEQYEFETTLIERQASLDPRFIVSETCWSQAMDVINEVKRQPYWKKGLKQAHFQQVLEGELEGVLVCGLPDRIDPLGNQKYRMVDLKVVNPIKTINANKWLWNAVEMGYTHQAALYQYLFAKAQGIPKENVIFAHATASPILEGYAESNLFILPQPLIDKAMVEVRAALRGIKAKQFEPKLKTWKDAEELPFYAEPEIEEDEEDNE